MALRWTDEQFREYMAARSSVPPADLEPAAGGGPVDQEKDTRHDTRCRLHVVSYRHRLADADGISAKALIDGLVQAGILKDDSPKYVASVTYEQIQIGKKEIEHTEIILTREG